MTHLLVRGSLATGTADRLSDVDLVVAVRDDRLPALIEDIEHAVRTHRSAGDVAARREVLRVAADLYGLLRSYCRRTGRLDLSLMVADRAIRAAEDADDPVRIAVGTWNLGHVLLSHTDPGAVEEAKDIALQAVDQLRHAAPRIAGGGRPTGRSGTGRGRLRRTAPPLEGCPLAPGRARRTARRAGR
nr:nucleotidyltransferase domain-containing protein [Streptomyces umbrinus]